MFLRLREQLGQRRINLVTLTDDQQGFEPAQVRFVLGVNERRRLAGVQTIHERFPEPLSRYLGILFTSCRHGLLLIHEILVNLPQVVGGLPGLPRHRTPHLEFLNGLIESHIHDELDRVVKIERAPADG